MHSPFDLRSWHEIATVVGAAAREQETPAVALQTLSDRLGFDSALLTSCGPGRVAKHRVIANHAYPPDVADYLINTYVRTCPGFAWAHERKVAVRICDTPFDFRETRTYREVLNPAGFHEGVTITFSASGARHAGMLAMSSAADRPLNREGCIALTLLAPELAAISEAPFSAVDGEMSSDDLIVEFDPTGTLRWLNSIPTLRTPLSENALRQFALQLRVSQRHQAGFFEKDAHGCWWRVRGFRRQVPGVGIRIVISLNLQAPRGGLTVRELDVLGLVSRGLTNNEIAETLTISLRTVKSHIESVLVKLDQTNRVGLASVAVDANLCSREYLI